MLAHVVRVLTQISVFLLLALWLPATQHCNFEAAGLITAETGHPATTACCDTDKPCADDGCTVVEDGVTKPASALFAVPAPDLSLCVGFLVLQRSLLATLDAPAWQASAAEQPRDWLPVWPFVRRAAPMAQAPSLLG